MRQVGQRLGTNKSAFARLSACLVMAFITSSFAAPLGAQTMAGGQTPASGIPSWVWVIGILIVLAIVVFAFMRRKKEAVITTSSTGRSNEPDIKTRG